MNDLISNNEEIINMIYEVRGKQVMLDSDLAMLYKCSNGTKTINQAVKRNLDRFPDDFYFQLTDYEFENLRSQFGTSSLDNEYGGRRYNPYVFTEEGVAQLSTVIHTIVAKKMSVSIMRAFVSMREYLGKDYKRISNIETKLIEHDNSIKLIQTSLDKLEEKKEKYFDGKIYDAYSAVLDIFKCANKELIIVDRYTDKTLLDMIKDLKCNIILITGKNTKISELDIEKYNNTYNNLKIYYDDTFHDRYFILDRETFYHSGNSINHIGYRKSAIIMLSDKNVKNSIMKDIDLILNK